MLRTTPVRFPGLLVALLGLVAAFPAASAQTAILILRVVRDPRTDLNQVPGSGASLHHITQSGSYFLSAPIQCGPGQTAISIDPAASSVVIDFNGFAVLGTPTLTSLHGLDCPPSTTRRASVTLLGPRILFFGGDGLHVESVDDVNVQDAVVAHCAGTASLYKLCYSVNQGASWLSQSTTGVSATDVETTTLADVDVQGCTRGIECVRGDVDLARCNIRGSSTEALLVDATAGPGGGGAGGSFHAQLDRCAIVGGDGCRVLSNVGLDLDLRNVSIRDCLGHGLDVELSGVLPVPSTRRVRTWVSVVERCAGAGLHVTRAVDDPVQVVLDGARFAQYGSHGVEIVGGAALDATNSSSSRNGGSGVHIAFSGSAASLLLGESRLAGLQCDGNGLDGLHLDATALPYFAKVSMQDAHFVNNLRDGLALANVTCQVTKGTFKSNGRDGLHAEDSDVDVSMLGVADNGENGVYTLRTRHKGWDGMIYGNHRSGIAATDSTVQYRNVQIYRNTEDGVRLTHCTYEQQLGNLDECGLNGLSATDSRVVLEGTMVTHNGQDGLHLERTNAWCVRVRCEDNGGDGIDASTTPGLPSTELSISHGSTSGNGGIGVVARGKATPKLLHLASRRNAAGGLAVQPLGGCSPVQVHVSDCSFDENGGVACDVSSAKGGAIERCTVSSSPVGIHVGDPSGAGCASGVRVADCTVSQCGTGVAVDAGSASLVVRNLASSCTVAPFAVGAGNLFGPVIATQTDLDLATNPNANYAP
ncbi:MAG: right-handed parallel beta-helix repeat-containing protein [Planctomycetes bacterium]|nr:right-handed parallel beta-helix repeat-containing protein [Planctomycetota bacterium]